MSTEIEIIKRAQSSELVRNIERPLLIVALNAHIAKAFDLCRFKTPSPKESKRIAEEYASDLQVYCPTLRLDEVPYLIKIGVSGQLGEFAGISNATLMRWTFAFMHSAARTEAKKQLALESAQKLLPPTEVLPEDYNERIYRGLCSIIEQEGKLPLTWAWEAAYLYAEAAGIVSDTLEEKKLFAEIVREEIAREIAVERDRTRTNKLNDLIANKILSDKEAFRVECRKRRLITFFKSKFDL